jgi:hypothetical protein
MDYNEGGCMISETIYQADLIERLYRTFPGCVVLKNDAKMVQGIPDLLILYKSFWAMLEVKINVHANRQSNQEYYIKKFAGMSFAAFIYPENEEDVLYALQSAFGSYR